MKKLVHGVGINDADYVVRPTINGRQVMCRIYMTWSNMITRCYNEKRKARFPSYIGCTVCDEWITFSNFKRWMEAQDWNGKHLDKDIIYPMNKQYGPNNCVFISSRLNMLLIDHAAKRGSSPIGVCWCDARRKFMSYVTVNGKPKHLGLFENKEFAHREWQKAKKELIYSAALEQDDERVKNALLSRCTQLQYDIDNGLETIKL